MISCTLSFGKSFRAPIEKKYSLLLLNFFFLKKQILNSDQQAIFTRFLLEPVSEHTPRRSPLWSLEFFERGFRALLPEQFLLVSCTLSVRSALRALTYKNFSFGLPNFF